MARPTAHLHQHLLQLPKLVHVNQCYIPGIETAYTAPAGHSFGQLAHVAPLGREAAALTHFTLLEADWSSRRTLEGQSQPS